MPLGGRWRRSKCNNGKEKRSRFFFILFLFFSFSFFFFSKGRTSRPTVRLISKAKRDSLASSGGLGAAFKAP